MHDLGTLIWVIVVIAAVVNGIRKSVGQARDAAGTARQRRPAPPLPAPAAVIPAPAVIPPAPPPVAPPPIRRVTPPPAPVPEQIHLIGIPKARSSGLLGGIFEDKKSILKAVVAAEILGKPKALQEQSIWSPRHSEPSM